MRIYGVSQKNLVKAVFVVVFVSIPLIAHAGFFSYVSGLFASASAKIEGAGSENSQNVALLHAAIASNPGARGGGDITVVSNSALLSETGPSGTLANIGEHAPTSDQISIYVVREGDSLSQIAKMFNVTTNTIVWANDIKRGDLITPGQTLVILPISGVRHTVKEGDTLASIAKKYDGHLEEIVTYNRLTEGATLTEGQIVVVPDGEIATPKVTNTVRSVAHSSASGPDYSGYYTRPTSGIKTQGIHGYNGVDIGAPTGTPIVAAASGEVIIVRNSGWNGGYGLYIVLKHPNGTQTLYAHNSQNIVSQGAWVVQGQVIGYVGSTGKSTGPHLHFEVRGAKNPF